MTNEELKGLATVLNNEAYGLDQAISLLQQEKERLIRMAAAINYQLAIANDTTADRQVSPEVVEIYGHYMMPLLNKFKKEAGDNGGA